jgi:membrane-bound serine protease (ClpP class)
MPGILELSGYALVGGVFAAARPLVAGSIMTFARNNLIRAWKGGAARSSGWAVALWASLVGAAFGADVSATRPEATTEFAPVSQAFILPIQDEITDITHDSLERRLKEIRDKNPKLIIIELDTPGGALGATLDICHMLKGLRDDGVHVYAWVNSKAYSGGTIIALATDGIFMVRNATIGDCQPIQFTSEGVSAIPKEVEAKATSPLLAELEDSVRRNGYNYDMVLALIRPEIEMFWVVNTRTGERRFVDAQGRDELFGLSGDKEGGGFLGLFRKDENKPRTPGELVSDDLSRTDWKYVKQDPVLGQVRQPIVSSRELLTMRTDKAVAFGFCKAVINTEDELRKHLNVTGSVIRLENTWTEDIIEWLASPMVRAVLFLLMLLGAYTEFQTPGFGVAGAVALVALVLFLGAPYLAGYTVTWEIVVIVLGIILLLVEAFVIPGFGVTGVLGLILLGIGLLASFVPAEPGFEKSWPAVPTLPLTYTYLKNGLYAMASGLVGSIVGMYFVARYFPKVPVASRLISPNPEHQAVQMDEPYQGVARVGDVGRAESLLRPAGKARFGSELVDVVSQGEYIQSGSRVQVVERRGNRIVVRPVE